MPKKANKRKKLQADRRKVSADLEARQARNLRFHSTRREAADLRGLGVAALGIAAVAASILRDRGN